MEMCTLVWLSGVPSASECDYRGVRQHLKERASGGTAMIPQRDVIYGEAQLGESWLKPR